MPRDEEVRVGRTPAGIAVIWKHTPPVVDDIYPRQREWIAGVRMCAGRVEVSACFWWTERRKVASWSTDAGMWEVEILPCLFVGLELDPIQFNVA